MPETWPTVDTAKRIAKRHGVHQVIVFSFYLGRYHYASYGKNASLCANAKRMADRLADFIEQGHLIR